MRFDDVLRSVGNTPHLRLPGSELPGAAFHVKLEGQNPTGSVKDRAGLRLIEESRADGRLEPGMTILDASSGNMGCALAYFGRLFGHPTRVIASSKLTADKRAFMEYFGARVEQTGDFTIEGNRRCREIAAAEPDRYCFLDQLHAWANPRAHYDGTGPEILADFPEVAMVVGSLGSGGTLLGTAQLLKEKRPQTAIVAVQAAAGTRLPGTGSFDEGDYVTPFIAKGWSEGLFDRRERVTEAAAVARTQELRDLGVFAGLQTGGVYAAAVAAARELGIRGDVVLISGDSGWKNMEKLAGI